MRYDANMTDKITVRRLTEEWNPQPLPEGRSDMTDQPKGHHVELRMFHDVETKAFADRFDYYRGELKIDGKPMAVLDGVSTEIPRDAGQGVLVTFTVLAESGVITQSNGHEIRWGDRNDTA